jgi:hypothetical protein
MTGKPYSIPTSERYFLDADGFCWREVEIDGEVMHSMARTNPDNSPTPRPLLYLTPVTQEQHTLRAYRLALMDAAAIFADTAAQHEGNTVGQHAYAEGARVLRTWATDPGRMLGPLHRHRAATPENADCPVCRHHPDEHGVIGMGMYHCECCEGPLPTPEKADRAVRCKAVRGSRQCVLNVDHQPGHVWERFDGDPPPKNDEALAHALLHNEHATRPNQHDEAVAAGEIDCPRQPTEETDHA